MASSGLDPAFGLVASCSSHVAGFGGLPTRVFVGIDGRPTMLCNAADQPPPPAGSVGGGRFRHPPTGAIRLVSFPPSGRPVRRPGMDTMVVGPPAAPQPAWVVDALVEPNRIVVLGATIRASRVVPLVTDFTVTRLSGGVATWGAANRSDPITLGAGVQGARLGRDLDGSDFVVGARLTVNRPSREPDWRLQLEVVPLDAVPGPVMGRAAGLVIQVPLDIDPSAGLDVDARVGGVRMVGPDQLLIALSFSFRPPGTPVGIGVERPARAALVGLRRTGTAPSGWELDPSFASAGLWVATEADGEATAIEHLAVVAGQVYVAGRAERTGIRSPFLAAFDAGTGGLLWSAYPTGLMTGSPFALAVDSVGRPLLCGSGTDFGDRRPDGPGVAVVARFSDATGELDPAFGTGGATRVRLHGATFATALDVAADGSLLLGTVVRWAGFAALETFDPCVTRLSSTGGVDQGFGRGGVCRHDGVGAAATVAMDAAGRLVAAGAFATILGTTVSRTIGLSRLTAEGELDGSFGVEGVAMVAIEAALPVGEGLFDVTSLVPLAQGKVVVAGRYYAPAAGSGDPPALRGSWILRLAVDGSPDPTFGTAGVVLHPLLTIDLLGELADGRLQGFEAGTATLRLQADGSVDPTFGTDGRRAITTTGPITLPHTVTPSGEWFGPRWGSFNSIGILRYGADGAVDAAFGAATNLPDRFVDPATAFTMPPRILVGPQWDGQGGRHETISAAGGFLTLGNMSWQVDLDIGIGNNSRHFTVRPFGLGLLAWNADGSPRSVPEWSGLSVRAVPNPTGDLIFSGSWIGWQYRCCLVQADGSILVGFAGEDPDVVEADRTPRRVRTRAYLCRLLPPAYGLDPAFGDRGVVVVRVPDDGYLDSVVDLQRLAGFQAVGTGGRVVAAVECPEVVRSVFEQNLDIPMASPDLPLDGSVAMVRLT